MGLLFDLLKILGEGETPKERQERINNKIFEDECEAFGMTKEEKEDCKKSGISPEEWIEENEPEYYDDLDK